MLNPFEVFGISPSADKDTAKKAYRKMAGKWHPDVNGGSPESEARFKEINEAWSTLEEYYKRKTSEPLWVHKTLFSISKKEN